MRFGRKLDLSVSMTVVNVWCVSVLYFDMYTDMMNVYLCGYMYELKLCLSSLADCVYIIACVYMSVNVSVLSEVPRTSF